MSAGNEREFIDYLQRKSLLDTMKVELAFPVLLRVARQLRRIGIPEIRRDGFLHGLLLGARYFYVKEKSTTEVKETKTAKEDKGSRT